MFSLIIALIAIVLVVALALAGAFYGGSVTTEGKARAQEAQYMNEGAQISAAAAAYAAENSHYAPDIQTLIDTHYLNANPSSGTWSEFEDTAYITNITADRCAALNAKQGITTAPSCSDPSIIHQTVCCVNE